MLKFRWETDFKEMEFGEVPKTWEVLKVEDVAKINELSVGEDFKQDRIEYIDITSVEKGELLGVQHLSLSEAPSRAKRIVRNNDILISTVRPNLKHFTFVKKANSNTIASTGFAVVTSYKIDPRYLYYFLTSEPITVHLSQIAETQTSAYPAFNPDVIENAKMPLPTSYGKPLGEDFRIGAVLSWYDDLIQNKKKQNELLEKTAIAIFKNWFIDFEPFSNSEFIDSALGKIPEGWEVEELEKAIKFLYGKGLPENKRKEGPFPVVGSSGIVGYHSKNLVSSPSIVVGRKGNAGSVYLMLEPSFPIDTVFYSSDNTPKDIIFYVYHSLRMTSLEDIGLSDTAVPGLSIHTLNSVKVLIPPQQILEKFRNVVEPLLRKMYLNHKQISVLERAQDSLLPLLVFGKLRVEEI
jgi:type I restriction enzyme S subunit